MENNIFVCHICNQSFKAPKLYTDHYVLHTNIANVMFPCCFTDCKTKWKKYSGFVSHFKRFHRSSVTNSHVYSKFLNICCTTCSKKFLSGKELITHVKSHLRSGQSILCPYDLCDKFFAKVQSFTSHISRYHNNKADQFMLTRAPNFTVTSMHTPEFELNGDQTGTSSTDTNCDGTSDHNFFSCIAENSAGTSNQNFDNCVLDTGPNSDLLLKDLSLFYIKLHTQYNIPAGAVQSIYEELNKFCFLNLEITLKFITSKLVDVGLPVELIETLKSEAIQKNEFHQSQNQLKSDYLRKQYFKNMFGFVQPLCIRLGYDSNNKLCFYHYVPILDSLTAFLNNDSVKAQLTEELKFSEGLLTDYKDGSSFKNHHFWKSQKLTLQIILYQDSFEVVNPLGSSKNKHKVLAMYYMLGNLHFYNRSKINAVQLVLMCKEKDYKQFKRDVFKPVVRDLKVLEDIGINIPDIGLVKGSVIFIVGDNLGSHDVGGFTENFSSNGCICRFCLITGEDFKEEPYFLTAPGRTVDSYNRAIQILESGRIEVCDGIKFNSVFNDLAYFHVCEPGMPPCIGHDLFGGIVPYDLSLIMRYFIKTKKLLTYNSLNRMIKNFPFKNDDAADRPGAILENKERVIGHSVQNWCLIRFITLIIYDKIVDKSDKIWKFLCLLQEIVSMISAKIISEGQVAYLEILIKEYLFDRKMLFPQKPLRPKHHYMLHYPSLILKYGPLIWLWTMRFESKHSFFKKAVRQSNNFKNITLTMSEKHQLQQAYLQTGQYFSDAVLMKDAKTFICSQYSEDILTGLNNCTFSHINNEFAVGSCVSIHGTEFKVGTAILLENNFPEVLFGLIKLILINASIVHFIVQPVPGKKDLDQYIYSIEEGSLSLICVEYNLLTTPSMTIYDINDKKYLVPKYAFID